MKWLEIIGVRTTATNRNMLEARLEAMMDDAKKGATARSMTLYHRLSIESDLSVHLLHESKTADLEGSRLGLLLANEMRTFGLVHHSVWAESAGVDTHGKAYLK